MKVAVISDIHGNSYALEQVLKSASKLKVEKLLVLGDIVGYYYHPDRVLEMLSKWDFEIIKGNHEIILEELSNGKVNPDIIKQKYGSGHQAGLTKLSQETMQWLFSLPSQKSVLINDISFQMNHGSPRNIDEYVYPDANKELLESCDSLKHDFVLIGHSHYAFCYRCNRSILINCGSVGQSRQNGGLAYWALVNTNNKSFEIKATPYNVTELQCEVMRIDPLNEYSYKVLTR